MIIWKIYLSKYVNNTLWLLIIQDDNKNGKGGKQH